MDLFIDDSPIDGAFAHEGTVEDALRHIQECVCRHDQLVVGLRCDGRDVPSQAMAKTLRTPASSYERVEVFTGVRHALVAEALLQASACLTETESACRNAAELFTRGQAGDGAVVLGECLRVWQQIHEAVARSIDMLRMDSETITVDDEPIVELIGRPREVLVEVREALKAQDHVLLADLLQYEFPTVTQSWHSLIGRLQREAEDLSADRDAM